MKYIVGRKKKKKGFTLMELLVSLGIIAALSMMVAPMIMGKVDEAKVKADISNANAIAVAVKSELLAGETFTSPITGQPLTDLANDYFDGKLPKPQSMGTDFLISITGNKVTVSVTVGEGQESKVTTFYPAQDSLLAESK